MRKLKSVFRRDHFKEKLFQFVEDPKIAENQMLEIEEQINKNKLSMEKKVEEVTLSFVLKNDSLKTRVKIFKSNVESHRQKLEDQVSMLKGKVEGIEKKVDSLIEDIENFQEAILRNLT